jgi:Tol biopolymer transport system component
MCRFLRFLADHNGQGLRLKETEIGVRVFDREVGYDPKIDSIVRTEATRLRRKLSEYYAGEGRTDPFRLQLPPGKYELEIVPQPVAAPLVDAGPAAAPTLTPATNGPVAALPAAISRRPRIWYAVACLPLLAAVALLWRLGSPAAISPVLETVPFTYFEGIESEPSFSPDGKTLAYTWDGEGAHMKAVYTQGLGASTPVRVTHSGSKESAPVWSPDGRRIAFLRESDYATWDLRIIDANGSNDTSIASFPSLPGNTPGLSWSPDGSWLVTAAAQGPTRKLALVMISPQTHEMKLVPGKDASASCFAPAFAQDGRIAYIKALDVGVDDVYVARFPEGHENRVTFDHAMIGGLAWSRNDKALIIASERAGGRMSLWRFPLGGAPLRLTESSQMATNPAVSRDGGKLVFSRRVDDINIWRQELAPGSRRADVALIASSALDSSPQFSPDGAQLAFRSSRSGSSEIWVSQADGSHVWQLTHVGGPLTGSPAWSPDGKWISYDSRQSGKAHIWVIPAGGGQPRRLTGDDYSEMVSSWSRDGKFVYYTTDRSGTWSAWRAGVSDGRTEFVHDGAFAAKESSDGYLYYARGQNAPGLFRAPLAGGPEEPVLPQLGAGGWGRWALGRGKVYFIDWVDKSAQIAYAQVHDLKSGRKRELFQLKHLVGFDGALAVAPDESSLVYAQLDRSGSDLFLVNNLR